MVKSVYSFHATSLEIRLLNFQLGGNPDNSFKQIKIFFCTTGGLLHSIPSSEEKDDTESKITSALKECVHETTRGGREVAINTLSEILFSYMKHIG